MTWNFIYTGTPIALKKKVNEQNFGSGLATRLTCIPLPIQYACQRHYFGAMAEAYFDNKLKDASVNVYRRQKTFEGFSRLSDEFTADNVMHAFNLSTIGAARIKIHRLVKDNLIEKCGEYIENGTTKAKYHKTGVIMC